MRARRAATAARMGALAAAAPGAMAACDGATEPNAPAVGRVELSVQPSRATVRAGDTLSIRVTARNRSRQTVRLDPGDCTPLAFEARDASGVRVAIVGFEKCAFIGGVPSYRLRPGESTTIMHRWAAVHGYGTLGPQDMIDRPLPAGRYELFGGLVSTRDSAAFVARSEPVTITVTE